MKKSEQTYKCLNITVIQYATEYSETLRLFTRDDIKYHHKKKILSSDSDIVTLLRMLRKKLYRLEFKTSFCQIKN